MSISATQVNELRKRTGVSMMMCKAALEEAGGDEEKAIEILRKKGAAKAAKKADRDTSEGVVITKADGNKAAIVQFLCETDFVAKNEEFVALAQKAADLGLEKGAEGAKEEMAEPVKELFAKLGENMTLEIDVLEGENIGDYVHTNGKVGVVVNLSGGNDEQARDVAMHIAAMNPRVIKPEDVSQELVDKEKEIWTEQLSNEGKPQEIIVKIMEGKEKKFREESALLKQSFVKDGDKTVEQYIEGSTVTNFIRKSI